MDLLSHLDRQEPGEESSEAKAESLQAEYADLVRWQCEAQAARDYERAAMLRHLAVDLKVWMAACKSQL